VHTKFLLASLALPCSFLLVASLSLAWFLRSGKPGEWLQRFIFAVVPVAALAWAAQTITLVLAAPWFHWNDIRLARAVAFARGYRIYPGRDYVGPIVGTLHTPFGHLVYSPLAWVSNPTNAILFGSCISCGIVFGALYFSCFHAGHERDRFESFACFLVAGLAMTQFPGLRYSIFNIHEDAPALALSTISAGLLCRSKHLSSRAQIIAASCAVLAVWAKQTMAPLLVALPLFLLASDGWPVCRRFLLSMCLAGIVVSAVLTLVFWPPEPLWFNVWTLSKDRPFKAGGPTLLFSAVKVIVADTSLFLMPAVWFVALAGTSAHWRVRTLFKEHRWLAFPFIALCMLPVAAKAYASLGGDVNHLSLVEYYLVCGTAVAMLSYSRPGVAPEWATMTAKIFMASLLLTSMTQCEPLQLIRNLAALSNNPSEQVFIADKQAPGDIYFPWNPLAPLLVRGVLFHTDYALFDREVGGANITRRQLASGLPNTARYVAIPPGETVTSAALGSLLMNSPRVENARLPGWTIYRMPAADGGNR